MRAMILEQVRSPLRLVELPDPVPGAGEVLVRVHACAVCRTDLHVVDGELPDPKLPIIPGHQIVGAIVACGAGVERRRIGERVGIPWLAWSCGVCRFCKRGQENLCPHALFHGYTRDGGYAELVVADGRYCFPLPDGYADLQAAPLLCAGLIGYRALRLTGDGETLGFYGFGQAAHLLIQVARHQGRRVFAFTRPGDTESQEFARSLGAVWAGDSGTLPPEPLDAAIVFAPVGALVPEALRALAPGGVAVCAGIHMSDIPSFPYRILWEERVLRSVANLTRQDAADFLEIALRVPVRSEVTVFRLAEANEALAALREGRINGSAVIEVA
jgi:propanol-preferring alcohol dehydrogenase